MSISFVLLIDLKIGKIIVNSIYILKCVYFKMILIGLTSVARASISNHLVIHVNEYDLLDLEFIYIFIYLTHSFSIFVHYFH